MLPIILAIEPDGRQAARVSALAPGHIDAEIVVVSSVAAALHVLETRRPDLVLTPPLFSSREDASLAARLRALEGDQVELPILVTPLLASGDEPEVVENQGGGGLLKRLKKQKNAPAVSNGCSPALFAAQITEYLVRLVAERHDREQARRKDEWMHPRGAASAPMLGELLTMAAFDPPPIDREERAAFHTFDMPAGDEVSSTSHVADEEVVAIPGVDDPVPIETSEPEFNVEPLVHEVVAATELAPEDEFGDLESILSDEKLEAEFREEESASVADEAMAFDSRASEAAAFERDAFEPDTFETEGVTPGSIEMPPADELWAQIQTVQAAIAPIEGPELKKRRAPAVTRTPKAARTNATSAVPGKPARSSKPKKPTKPMQDEWGLYDPEQCGFAALLERLEDLTEPEADGTKEEGRSGIMRR